MKTQMPNLLKNTRSAVVTPFLGQGRLKWLKEGLGGHLKVEVKLPVRLPGCGVTVKVPASAVGRVMECHWRFRRAGKYQQVSTRQFGRFVSMRKLLEVTNG